MKRMRLLLLALACALTSNAAKLDVTPSTVVEVDLTPAIKIDGFTTSRYLFDKAYQQFVASFTRRTGRQPTTAELEPWFRLYLAQQFIKAGLVEEKQPDRPEVVEITERMSRYMLTQPHGPLYRELGGADPTAFRQARRTRILKECQFSAFSENIAQLWNAVALPFSRRAPLREADVALIGSSVVASYSFGGVTRQISALDFVGDFQRGIARIAPHDLESLRQQIEDIAVTEYDLADAKRLRLDQTAQFREDRHNFALNQALALHENEVLAKQSDLSRAELEAYYQSKRTRYCSPVEIKGALFIFPDLESARLEMNSLQKGTASSMTSYSPDSLDPFTIQRDAPPVFAEISYPLLVSLPVGQRIGPFAHAGKYAIFLKRADGELAPIPYTSIQDQLHRDLSREKIESAELECLSKNLSHVQLSLDLSAYKIEDLLPPLQREGLHVTAPNRGE